MLWLCQVPCQGGCLSICPHEVAGRFCYGMAAGWGRVSLLCAVHSYAQDLMTLRNVNQRFNKQNPMCSWRTQMCMKLLPDPPRRVHFWGDRLGVRGDQMAKETSHDLQSVRLPGRPSRSSGKWGPFSPRVYSSSILCLFVLLCRKRKRSSFQNHQRCGLFRQPQLSSSFFCPAFLKCSFANMASFTLRRAASTIHAIRLSEILPWNRSASPDAGREHSSLWLSGTDPKQF